MFCHLGFMRASMRFYRRCAALVAVCVAVAVAVRVIIHVNALVNVLVPCFCSFSLFLIVLLFCDLFVMLF